MRFDSEIYFISSVSLFILNSMIQADGQFFCKLNTELCAIGLKFLCACVWFTKNVLISSTVVCFFVLATCLCRFCWAMTPACLCDPLLVGFSCWCELVQLCWWLLPSAGCPSCLTPVRPCRWSGGSFPWLAVCLRYCRQFSIHEPQTTSDELELRTLSYQKNKSVVVFVMSVQRDVLRSQSQICHFRKWVGDNIFRQITKLSKSLCRLMLYQCDLDIG